MKNLFLLALMGMFLFTSCGAQESASVEPYKAIPFAKYSKEIASNEVLVVDVRTPSEFNQGHIEGAINIDFNGSDFSSQISKFDTEKPIYIYCRSGARSRSAGNIMHRLGFKEVIDLRGGILTWRGEVVK